MSDLAKNARLLWASVRAYFSLADHLVPQADAEAAIRDGVNFRGTNILILIFAIFIASLGLNTNSTAVIIGAMLISPLMGPIIGMGLGVGIHDFDLIKRSLRNLAMAAIFSLLASTVYFLISPVNQNHSELLARTSPTIYDVLIAFFGGAAGIVAMGSRSKGNVIPGVAIATALMPPLCTAGYGLATGQFHYFFGALYLFIINSIFIGFATLLFVKMMGYQNHASLNEARARKVRRMVTVLVIATALPAIYSTYTMIKHSSFQNRVDRFVNEQFKFPDTRVLSFNATTDGDDHLITVTLIGRILAQDSLEMAMNAKLEGTGFKNTKIKIIQGEYPELRTQDLTPDAVKDIYQIAQLTLSHQTQTIDSLRYVLDRQVRLDTVARTIAPEIAQLFPQIEELAIAHTMFANVATQDVDTMHLALITCHHPLDRTISDKLVRYLQVRLQIKPIHLIDVGHQLHFTPPARE